MAIFSKMNAVLDWTGIKAYIDSATDPRYIYNETDASSGSTVRIQTLLQLVDVGGTPTYIASRTQLSTNTASGVADGTAVIPNTIATSTVSPEAAYTAAKAADYPEV